jgi:hypothetical protein
MDFAFVDLNKDNKDEIILVGINNEYEKGCVVVLDTERMDGSSPQSKAFFSCRELKEGHEIAYTLLPRTEMDKNDPYPGECICLIDILRNNRIRIRTSLSGIYYEFDFRLVPQDVRKGSVFDQKYSSAITSGKVKKTMSDGIWPQLLREIKYWDRINWVAEPIMHSF